MDIQAEYVPIRLQLEQRLHELQGQVAHLEHHLRRVDGPHSADFEEQATDQEGDEVMQALDDSGRRELQDIESALAMVHSTPSAAATRSDRPWASLAAVKPNSATAT